MDQLTTTNEDVAQLAREFTQWFLAGGKAGPVQPKATFAQNPERNFSLKGSVPRKFLQWEKQTFGINLGWTDNASPDTGKRVSRWFVDRPGTASGPIRYGELVSLGYGITPSFLHYAHRTVGINLDWSDNAVFEWKLLGGAIGAEINTRAPVAIYNSKAGSAASPGSFLMHFDRTVGGDIGWPDSRTWGEQLGSFGTGLAWSAAKKLVLAELGIPHA